MVAVTAFAMRGDEERIREAGCEAYLSKPIPVPQFIETIRRFLGVPEHSGPLAGASNSQLVVAAEKREALNAKLRPDCS